MGIVYAVQHTLTDECFALKVMMANQAASPEAIERFKREARTSSRIKSEHVVRVLDADVAPELGGAPYLVMDLLEGADLEQVSDDKPVDAERVVEWLRQVARPIDKAHRSGIIHRDLKPENLFLTHREDGSAVVKILDFGIAKIAAESTGTTQSGQLLGTPLYMAPEQARGDSAQIGPTTDLFALGLIAYKLLTGIPYWRGTSVAGIIGEILYEPLAPPSARGHSFGEAFDTWFLRACHRDPPQRFESAEEQVEALARALGLPVRAAARPGASSSGIRRDSLGVASSVADLGATPGSRAGSSGVLVSVASAAPQQVETKWPRRPESASSASAMSRSDALVSPKWRRGVLVTVSVAAVLSVVLIVLYRRGPANVSTFGNKRAAAATESVVALVATTLPPVAPAPSAAPPHAVAEPPAPSASPLASAVEAPTAPAAPPSSLKKEPLRAWRTSLPPPPRRERSQVDDVLTDQK